MMVYISITGSRTIDIFLFFNWYTDGVNYYYLHRLVVVETMAIAKGMVHFIFYDRAKLLFSSRQVRQKYQTLGLFEAQTLRTVTTSLHNRCA